MTQWLFRSLQTVTIIASVMFLGCSNMSSPQTTDISTSTSTTSEIRITSLPPSAKSVIGALLSSSEIPLSIDESCHQAGTDLDDQTLGDFLSGLLVELQDPDARNYVDVEIIPAIEEMGYGDGWIARVMVGQSQGEIVWRWGVEFFIRQQDGVVDPNSYRCRIAG